MELDLYTTTMMTALVATVAGLLFITETLFRRDAGAGRLWAVGYLCGMSTTFAYMAWASNIGGSMAIAIGNTLFVGTAGFMWSGCRKFNDRQLPVPAAVVGVLGAATFITALLEADALDSWGGWGMMAFGISVLFGAAAVETMRRPVGRIRTAWALAFVLAAAALFYAVRLVLFLTVGHQDPLFAETFGSIPASFVTVVLTVVAVVVTSLLRATKVSVQRYEWLSGNGVAADGIMLAPTFAEALRDIVERAGWRRELVGVAVVHIEGLDEMAAAFGAEPVDALTATWRQAVRRFAPAGAFVGEDGDAALSVCGLAVSAADARRQAAAIYSGCIEELASVVPGLLPVVGVGVALTETLGYDAQKLQESARAAAARAATSIESSVLFGGLEEARSRLP